jgi:hypothetical protein
MTSLSAPLFNKEIDTLADLREFGIEVWYSSQDISSLISQDKSLSEMKFFQKNEFRLKPGDRIGFLGRLNNYDPGTESAIEYKSFSPQHMVKECLVSYHLAYLLPKGSPYLPPINLLIRKILEAGLVIKWVKDGLSTSSSSSNNNEDNAKPFTIRDMLPAFLIFLAGILLSSLVFIYEMLKFKISQSMKRKKSVINIEN